MAILGLVLVAAFCMPSVLATSDTKRVLDMTYAQGPDAVTWPTLPDWNFTILNREQHPDYWFEANYISEPEHIGTHMDAPAHLKKGGWRVHQIPIDRLMGPGVVIDVKDKASSNADYQVTVQDLLNWEAVYGKIPTGAVVLMYSGWGEKYPNKTEVFRSTNITDPSTFHFPGFHHEAATWLVTFRDINLVGVDTPSIDYGKSTSYPSHVTFFSANIPGLENVANLAKLPVDGSATVYAAVHKIFDGSGGPTRIFAVYEEESQSTNGANMISEKFIVVCVAVCLMFLSV